MEYTGVDQIRQAREAREAATGINAGTRLGILICVLFTINCTIVFMYLMFK